MGATTDPKFGPVVVCGAGGTEAEIRGDIAVRLTPLSDTEAAAMIRGLRMLPLLTGYRGAPPCDIAAVEDVVLRLAAMVHAHPQIAEVDLNPVSVSPHGVVILDARVRIGHADAPTPWPSLRATPPGALTARMGVPLYLIHPASLGHLTGPGHPDAPGRIGAIERELERRDWCGHVRRQAGAAPEPAIAAVHTADHIARCGPAGARRRRDGGRTRFPRCRPACGGGRHRAGRRSGHGQASTGFCAVRPPGHHAAAASTSGFCLFNNVAWRRSMRSTARVCDA